MNPNQLSSIKSFNITGNGTVALTGNKLVLIALVINTKGGSSNTVKIYDSNETLGANADLKKGTLDTASSLGRFDYGIPCFNGIYLVVGGGTTPDITVIYAETP